MDQMVLVKKLSEAVAKLRDHIHTELKDHCNLEAMEAAAVVDDLITGCELNQILGQLAEDARIDARNKAAEEANNRSLAEQLCQQLRETRKLEIELDFIQSWQPNRTAPRNGELILGLLDFADAEGPEKRVVYWDDKHDSGYHWVAPGETPDAYREDILIGWKEIENGR